MEQLAPIVIRARQGESRAFEELVRRFQDMAVGYAFSMLGDWHEAEDAAQDAFVNAYCSIIQLRDAAAFPGLVSAHRLHAGAAALARQNAGMGLAGTGERARGRWAGGAA